VTVTGNWGRWGEDDERGALNLCTPERALAAAHGCATGKVYGLALPIGRRTPHVWDRPDPLRLTLTSPSDATDQQRFGAPEGTGSSEDVLVLPSHSGTHMDALSHVFAGDAIYNGFPATSFASRRGASRCGIQRTAAFAGQGVLLDVAGHEGVDLVQPGRAITSADLESCRAAQGSQLASGDVLLIRTGWTEVLARREALPHDLQPGIGLDAVEFIRDHDLAVVGADNAAVEVIPFDRNRYLGVHIELLVHLGVTLLEHLWLAELAADGCRRFMLAVGGLPVVGATGSPVNPIAIA
jgi:kynurenine formamidase